MAKVKVKARRPAVRARPKMKPAKTVGEDVLDLDAAKAAAMYYDPCNAALVPSVYPGDRGYMGRWTSTLVAGGAAGETATIWVAKPGVNVGWNAASNVAAGPVVVGLTDVQMPGAGFLNATAGKIRCPGFCSSIRPNASVNNATGMINYGILPANMVTQGVGMNVDTLVPLLTNRVACSQAVINPLEICWSPGPYDDRYCIPTGVTADDDFDRNILVVIATGLPPGTGLDIRNTGIYEWSPFANNIDATSVNPSRCDFKCILRNLKKKDSNWWWTLGKRTAKTLGSIVGAYTTGGVGAAAIKMASYV
jgi:hypothetical protein